jgi:hypothetical protein
VSPGIQVHPPAFAAADRSMTIARASGDGRDPRHLHTRRVAWPAAGRHAADCGGGGPGGRGPRRPAVDEFR